MNKYALVIFLGIVMISSTYSISSSDALLPANLPDVSQAPDHVRVIEGENIIAYARPLYTSLDDPSNHVVPTTDLNDGVARLILDRTDFKAGCSGTLASDGLHIITAAHCVTDDNGFYNLKLGSGSSATFEGNFEPIVITIDPTKSKAHPDYDGDFIFGNDIAVLELTRTADSQIPRIPHANTASVSAVDDTVDKNGYGWYGYFSSGAIPFTFGIEREGQNKYDAFADTMYKKLGLTSGDDFIPEAIYQYDSDDGNPSHDAFDFFFEISDLGLTIGDKQEVISAPGDSGGPSLVDTTDGIELVGIVSYGITLEYTRGPFPRTSDCTLDGIGPGGGSVILDSSCGEFAGDTRVSAYSSWIDFVISATHGGDPNTSPVASDDSASTDEDTAKVITLEGTDVDGDALTLFTIASGPTSGSLGEIGGITCDVNTTSNCTADVTYTPDPNFNGADSFTFTVKDATLTSTAATVDINIIDINDDPVADAGSDQIVLDSDSSGAEDVTLDGSGSSDDGTITDYVWTAGGSQIATGINPTVSFSVGTHEVTLTVTDNDNVSDTDTVTIVVSDSTASVDVDSISYDTYGGRLNDRHLDITVALLNDSNPVSEASVSIDLYRGGEFVTSGTGTTGTGGTVTFTLNNAASGCYTTVITDVTASGLTWDRSTPDNGPFCK